MDRLKRPLDADAVAAADDQLYALHEGDPRPNALFDAQGNRKPVDPADPSQAGLRQQWRDLYSAALEKSSTSAASDSPKSGEEPKPKPDPDKARKPRDVG